MSYDETSNWISNTVLSQVITNLNPMDLRAAIHENADPLKVFSTPEGEEFMRQVEAWIKLFPDKWVYKALKGMSNQNNILRFINNDLKHSYPQHYVMIAYHPRGCDYVVYAVQTIVAHIKELADEIISP